MILQSELLRLNKAEEGVKEIILVEGCALDWDELCVAGRHIVRSRQLVDFSVAISRNNGVQFPVVRANRRQNVSRGEHFLSQSPHRMEVQFGCGFRELRRLQTLHLVDDEQAEAG